MYRRSRALAHIPGPQPKNWFLGNTDVAESLQRSWVQAQWVLFGAAMLDLCAAQIHPRHVPPLASAGPHSGAAAQELVPRQHRRGRVAAKVLGASAMGTIWSSHARSVCCADSPSACTAARERWPTFRGRSPRTGFWATWSWHTRSSLTACAQNLRRSTARSLNSECSVSM